MRGIGDTNDRIPLRRTGTVIATRPLAAMCFAFQLSGATVWVPKLSRVLSCEFVEKATGAMISATGAME